MKYCLSATQLLLDKLKKLGTPLLVSVVVNSGEHYNELLLVKILVTRKLLL